MRYGSDKTRETARKGNPQTHGARISPTPSRLVMVWAQVEGLMAQQKIPGLVVAVARHGSTVYSQGKAGAWRGSTISPM